MRVPVALCALLWGLGSSGQAHKPAAPATPKQNWSGAAFGTIKATDPTVVNALDAKDLAGGKKLVEKEGAFKGTVSKVFQPASGKIVVLDFSPNYRDAMTAVIKNPDPKLWPNLDTLTGKLVLISGKFELYRNAPQIVLAKSSQVKLIK